jgi:hypothetical protein
MQQPGSLTKFTLDQQPDSYLDLRKWFTEDAAKIKDKMWTNVSFLNLIHNQTKITYE